MEGALSTQLKFIADLWWTGHLHPIYARDLEQTGSRVLWQQQLCQLSLAFRAPRAGGTGSVCSARAWTTPRTRWPFLLLHGDSMLSCDSRRAHREGITVWSCRRAGSTSIKRHWVQPYYDLDGVAMCGGGRLDRRHIERVRLLDELAVANGLIEEATGGKPLPKGHPFLATMSHGSVPPMNAIMACWNWRSSPWGRLHEK